ncbi:MAG: class I adenylate cyclase [Desulfobacterales bacterium]|nr:class I adenylate cyclase [Desulfobacterales bacterium]
MSQTSDQEQTLKRRILQMKSAFSSYNVVRMREALRYLSGPKLSLFIQIPFLIHVNLPEVPGFVPDAPDAHGIFDFEESGFYKEGKKQGNVPDTETGTSTPDDPCVLGLYHIGSLGTFTQSSQSDFDYWVIIDKTRFTEQRYYNFEKKLDHIIKFSREDFDQEVTFFIMDQADIRRDCYAGFNKRETLTAPKLFLKEEFYRTFLMIAGKIPIWTILPSNIKKGGYGALVKKIFQTKGLSSLCREFIDLGKIEPPEKQDILRGILWHICKSRQDPVKALIKATMIISHRYGNREQSGLLCDEIKAGFSEAGIDDYRADPYKVLFDRVIDFHETHAPDSLNLIKNAIFFRLCEYPMVRPPEPGSPKKQLLDKYIRSWNLTPAQIKKLLSYPSWAEGEKRLLERTFVKRLSQMYAQVSKDASVSYAGLDKTDQRNLKILIHKTRERLNSSKNKIRECSTYLTRHSFEFFLFREKKAKGWELTAYAPGGSEEILLHQSRTFLGLIGWIIENRLYLRHRATMKVDVKSTLFESRDEAVTADTLYLALQPVKPLSEDGFEHAPQWVKLMILLVSPSPSSGFARVEFLAVNTWGELYEDQLELDTGKNMDDRYKDIAEKINQYEGEQLKLLFYQLAPQREKDAVYRIKLWLSDRFLVGRAGSPKRKRPLLDKL